MDLKQMFDYFRKSVFLMSMFIGVIVFAQQKTITGTVYADGSPLPGASVMAKDTKVGTATDFDGKFSLYIASNVTKLVVSYMGYVTQEVEVTSSPMEITLQASANMLDEVVVTALGIKREQKALGYATQNIDGDAIQRVKGANPTTALTGKVAGLLIKNPSDFASDPSLTIRGGTPLIVIDGIPYQNRKLTDLSADDVESISVLKGSTASALYGYKGADGVVLVTTKSGKDNGEGLNVDFSSTTLFESGFLAIPEKQGVYGRGENNTYQINASRSWGAAMDGTIRTQWNPNLKANSDYAYLPTGVDNFKNFLEQGYVTNNNLQLGYRGVNSGVRASVNWVQNKGIYPNSKQDKYTYALSGDIDFKKIKLSSNVSYARNDIPNKGMNGYTSYDPMYSLLIYGPADFDIRDYKNNYWVTENQVQNYTLLAANLNNPYFDMYEKINEVSRDIFNADMTATYSFTKWADLTLRSGVDFYVNRGQLRVAWGSKVSTGNTGIPGNDYTWNGTNTGAYASGRTQGSSLNTDLFLSGNKELGKFGFEYIAGGAITYKRDDTLYGATNGGISIPDYYSLKASVNTPSVVETTYKQQVNSLYSRLALSFNKLIYLDFTGRNDWNSTLVNDDESYFYPSASASFVISELLGSTKSWMDLLKLRGSWALSKAPAGIYTTNSTYTINSNIWNTITGANYPTSLRADFIKPTSTRTYEIGLQGMFLKKRANFDFTYYNKRLYDRITNGTITQASGFSSVLVNTDEIIDTKGWELTLGGAPIKTDNFKWDLNLNFTKTRSVWAQLDPLYTANKPWNKVGERTDVYLSRDFVRRPGTGEIIYNSSGRVIVSSYDSVFGYIDPDVIWGMTNNFNYKNFSLYFALDGVSGGMMKTMTESYMWDAGIHPESITPERALDVANPGTSNYIGQGVVVVSGSVSYDPNGNILSDTRTYAPNTTATTYSQMMRDIHAGTAWGGNGRPDDLYSKTFFKIREISLTYTIPNTLAEKMAAKSASISLIGQNVFLWAKDFKYSDPDGGYEDFADPSMRYLGANVKLSF